MRYHPKAKCEDCTLKSEETYVPSDGPINARFAFVGIAPSYQEVKLGKPMTGPSGKLLEAVLHHHGLNRDECFITNVVSCQTPENRDPSKHEIACCSDRLKDELIEHTPEVIFPLGNQATGAIMGTAVKITELRAGPPKQSELYPDIKIIPTFHPAYCLRTSDAFPSLVTDVGKAIADSGIHWEDPEYRVY